MLTFSAENAQFWAMRKPTLTIRPYPHSKTHRFVLDLRPFGKGRKFFRSRDEAKAERRRQLIALERHGREAIGLSPHELSGIMKARERLAEYGKTMVDAADFLIHHLEIIRRCKITVAQLADEVLEAKRKDGRSEAYRSDLKLRLGIFCRDFGKRLIAAITVEEIDNWLRALNCSLKSRANYRANIGVLFSYAEKRGMIEKNPVPRTAKPKLVDHPPEIFTVDELRALLEAAQRIEPDVLPTLAIGAFSGLRDAEIKRLDWSEVNLRRGFIDVKAAKAKSARRRLVPILPNLAEWLKPYSTMKGHVVPQTVRGKIDRVCEGAALARWPQNGLRHSFASYRLAAIHDAPRVASELGHTSPQMLYSTYRELVLPEEAERYWKIEPVVDAKNVVAFTKTASTHR